MDEWHQQRVVEGGQWAVSVDCGRQVDSGGGRWAVVDVRRRVDGAGDGVRGLRWLSTVTSGT